MNTHEEITRQIAQRVAKAQSDLTEDQTVEALLQAWPDFMRSVQISTNNQAVTYLPGREAHYWRERCRQAEREIEELKSQIEEK